VTRMCAGHPFGVSPREHCRPNQCAFQKANWSPKVNCP
jgi:hypothetical protein